MFSLPESSSSGTLTNGLDNSNRLIIKYRFRVLFVLVFLSQTSRQTALSKDPACQSFIIAISYGVLVIYSIDYAGGSLNFAYAFAQDFWNQVEYGQQSAFKFLGNYFICNLCGGLLALAIHSLITINIFFLSLFTIAFFDLFNFLKFHLFYFKFLT